jgi:predicted component of viral defense system (DUF524 family)
MEDNLQTGILIDTVTRIVPVIFGESRLSVEIRVQYPFASSLDQIREFAKKEDKEYLIKYANIMLDLLSHKLLDLNDSFTRKELKDLADQYCYTQRLYEFKNVCDETNNSPVFIDENKIALDSYINVKSEFSIKWFLCIAGPNRP